MMIRILFALLIFPVIGFSQVYVTQDNPNQFRDFQGSIQARKNFRLPVLGGHTYSATDSVAFIRYDKTTGQVYYFNGVTMTWVVWGSGGGGTTDSNIFATNYRVDTAKTNLRTSINSKLNISDTAGKWIGIGTLTSLVKYGDTAAMMLPYTRKADFLDSMAAHWAAIQSKQAQLNGTGFVKASGTTISYDNSTYTPTSRTLTINGVTQDLSANRTYTIPGTDTTALRADIDRINDTLPVLRTDVNSKEPIITPGTTAQYWRGDKTWQSLPFIPDSTSDYWTRKDADTSLSNVRSEMLSLPYVDSAWQSNDTIYATKGGVQFVVAIVSGGGLDTTLADARYLRQGGDATSDTLKVGTTNNFRTSLIDNGLRVLTTGRGSGNTGFSLYNSSALNFFIEDAFGSVWVQGSGGVINNAIAGVWSVQTAAGANQRMVMNNSGNVGIGFPFNGTITAKLQVKGTSTTTGSIAIFENSAGNDAVIIRNDLGVEVKALSGTGTGVVTADDDGELSIQRPPASGTYTLKSVDGVIQWVED